MRRMPSASNSMRASTSDAVAPAAMATKAVHVVRTGERDQLDVVARAGGPHLCCFEGHRRGCNHGT